MNSKQATYWGGFGVVTLACGYVRTPTLRNVAIRQSFVHNGSLNSLREVLEFYNTRGTDPQCWFGKRGVFNDMAPEYRDNVNMNSPPLNRKQGVQGAMSAQDINDLLVFMRSLTEARYVALHPADPLLAR